MSSLRPGALLSPDPPDPPDPPAAPAAAALVVCSSVVMLCCQARYRSIGLDCKSPRKDDNNTTEDADADAEDGDGDDDSGDGITDWFLLLPPATIPVVGVVEVMSTKDCRAFSSSSFQKSFFFFFASSSSSSSSEAAVAVAYSIMA